MILSGVLFAQQYPFFTTEELKKIELKNGYIAKNRILDYTKTMKKLKEVSHKKQLRSINFYLNQLLPQYDDIINKKEDYWATPKEFLISGYGDCEDYAIIKYFSLIRLGFDEKKLFITVVQEKFYNSHHMVLTYFEEKHKSPLVLDNLSFQVLQLNQRKDIKAETFINSTGVYKIRNAQLVKFAHSSKEYANLLERIQKEQLLN